jgi:hypothetical protein
MDAHQIAIDGSSYAILMPELITLYNGGQLSGLPTSYSAYDLWEQERIGSPAIPELPLDFPRDHYQRSQVCLVAIDPESNYIILERYAKDRSGATWNEALTGALGNLPVKIIQGTSDEGKGLINHVTKGLNGHHSPDLFHVMHEISKGT